MPIKKIKGRICLSSFEPNNLSALLVSLKSKAPQDPRVAYIILDFSFGGVTNTYTVSPPNLLHIHAAATKTKSKLDTHFLQYILPTAIPFMRTHLSLNSSNMVSIIEGCGNDPGSRLDMSAGIVVTAIQLFFDENGTWSVGKGSDERSKSTFFFIVFPFHGSFDSNLLLTSGFVLVVDKKSIRKRLEWVIESEPRVNPSRATLKRVNEYLLTPTVYLVSAKTSGSCVIPS
jgi:tRNA A64-2'-O-ribosylphosphate transferase